MTRWPGSRRWVHTRPRPPSDATCGDAARAAFHADRTRRARSHPAGLTPAQVRVLEQLARGLSNTDIARELFLSPRTVDHHVSAILAKLDVTTRAAAIAATHARRLLQNT